MRTWTPFAASGPVATTVVAAAFVLMFRTYSNKGNIACPAAPLWWSTSLVAHFKIKRYKFSSGWINLHIDISLSILSSEIER
jgi:hypothetical protein